MPTSDPRLTRTARVLSRLSGGASSLAAFLPSTPASVAGAIAAALGLAADIADVGLDPVTTIERARSAEDALAEMRRRWEAKRKASRGG